MDNKINSQFVCLLVCSFTIWAKLLHRAPSKFSGIIIEWGTRSVLHELKSPVLTVLDNDLCCLKCMLYSIHSSETNYSVNLLTCILPCVLYAVSEMSE